MARADQVPLRRARATRALLVALPADLHHWLRVYSVTHHTPMTQIVIDGLERLRKKETDGTLVHVGSI